MQDMSFGQLVRFFSFLSCFINSNNYVKINFMGLSRCFAYIYVITL